MGAQMVAVVVMATVPLPRTSFRIAAIRKGRRQDRHIGAGEAVCDDVADAAGLDDVAECAACAGDEDDGTAALNTALEAVQNLLT